jgi:hypothetical protein
MRIIKLFFSFSALMLVGCKSDKVIQYKTISFADTNGVTTVYYPVTMEKDMIHIHEHERWKYPVSKNVSDDGKAKLMLVKP